MLRPAFACAALLLAGLSPAPAAAEALRFDVQPQKGDQVQLRIASDDEPQHHDNWSQTLPLGDLQGFDRAAAQRGAPVTFRLARPAGTFDCQGRGHDGRAEGHCTLTANPAFLARMAAHGIARPDARETFQLAMSGVSPDVIDALAAEGWERPTPKQLVETGIFHVDAAMVRGVAQAGYKGGAIKTLIDFAIFHVTPDYIRAMRGAGLGAVPANKMVQLRIFNVTPDDVRALAGGPATPSAGQLMKLRLAGVDRNALHARD